MSRDAFGLGEDTSCLRCGSPCGMPCAECGFLMRRKPEPPPIETKPDTSAGNRQEI